MNTNEIIFNDKPGRPVKYKSDEEKRQAKIESKKKWRDQNKERLSKYRKMYYENTHVSIKDTKNQNTIQPKNDFNEESLRKFETIIAQNQKILHTSIKKNKELRSLFKPNLVLIRGPPGSGKTTYAKFIYYNYEYVSVDDYFVSNGEYKFDKSKQTDANIWCKNKILELLNNNRNVVVANPFKTYWEINDYVDSYNEIAEIKVLRITSQYKNIHNVSIEIINNYYKEYQTFPNERYVCLDIKTKKSVSTFLKE